MADDVIDKLSTFRNLFSVFDGK